MPLDKMTSRRPTFGLPGRPLATNPLDIIHRTLPSLTEDTGVALRANDGGLTFSEEPDACWRIGCAQSASHGPGAPAQARIGATTASGCLRPGTKPGGGERINSPPSPDPATAAAADVTTRPRWRAFIGAPACGPPIPLALVALGIQAG